MRFALKVVCASPLHPRTQTTKRPAFQNIIPLLKRKDADLLLCEKILLYNPLLRDVSLYVFGGRWAAGVLKPRSAHFIHIQTNIVQQQQQHKSDYINIGTFFLAARARVSAAIKTPSRRRSEVRRDVRKSIKVVSCIKPATHPPFV